MPFVVSNIGLEMPDDFPVSYEAVNGEARQRQWAVEPNREFAGGWRAIAFRFRAVCHHADEAQASLAALGPGPPADGRWRRELHIFGFFANGLAVLESALYACFVLGHLSTRPQLFPFSTAEHRKKVKAKSVAAAFQTAFPQSALTTAISGVVADQNYLDWCAIRNVLTHRQAPGLHHFMSSKDKTVVGTQPKFQLTPQFATNRRTQLSTLLRRVVDEVPAFMKSEVP